MPTTAPNRVPFTPLHSRARLPLSTAQSGMAAISPVGLDRSIRTQLENLTGETFVSFASVEDSVSIWAADDRGMHFYKAESPLPAIQSFTRELLSLLAGPGGNRSRIQWLSRRLYQVLFRPIAQLLEPSRSIAVHFSGDLQCVPVSLLESEGGEPLLERFATWNAADFPWQVGKPIVESIPVDARLLIVDAAATASHDAARAPSRLGGDLGFAGAAFPNHDVIRSASATRDEFNRLALQAEVLHCRTALTEAVRCPCLHFAFDEADRATLPLPGYSPHALPHCALGVLDVEYGGNGAGEETPELWQRACNSLHSAGIANVVIPRWNLPVEPRRAFLEAFYEGLSDGASVLAARRSATLKLRSVPEWRHPHYWAGFVLSVSHL